MVKKTRPETGVDRPAVPSNVHPFVSKDGSNAGAFTPDEVANETVIRDEDLHIYPNDVARADGALPMRGDAAEKFFRRKQAEKKNSVTPASEGPSPKK